MGALEERAGLGEEMEKEPQYLFLEAEHSIRAERGGRQGLLTGTAGKLYTTGAVGLDLGLLLILPMPLKGARAVGQKAVSVKLKHRGWKELRAILA